MNFKVHYTPRQITTKRPFYGTGWPVRNPSGTCLVERSEYRRQKYAWIACTQLGPPYKPADQKRIVREWCEFFDGDSPLRELALRSRVAPQLFEAVCCHQQLTRLHVKWGPVKDLTPLRKLQQLEGLSLGTTSVEDISPVADLPALTMLQLVNLKHVRDLGPLAAAARLQFLEVEGYWQGPQKTHLLNLEFARELHDLRALSIGYVIVEDLDVTPLLGLTRLEYLDLPSVSQRDRDRLIEALPALRHGSVVHSDGG